MLRVDLHTHSTASPDGGISTEQYTRVLEDGLLDYIAVTDHGTIEQAKKLHQQFGDKIIVGQEIATTQGEIIGLFLKEPVRSGLTPIKAIEAIRKQHGLVYVPHPFETVRSGLNAETIEALADEIDIIETYNGRAVFQNKGPQATVWARTHQKPMAAASDAHGYRGLGSAYTSIKDKPTSRNLLQQLSVGHLMMHRPPLHTLLYPKLNRLKRRLKI